ncbi:MAG: hypothetical protein VXZ55_01970, partial [Planctomycetota bacterium]|nr:hypothetical protein [Planctomycetota bacterium]
FVFGQKPACTLNIDLHGKHWIPLWQLPGEPYVPGGLTSEGRNGSVTVRDQQRRNLTGFMARPSSLTGCPFSHALYYYR